MLFRSLLRLAVLLHRSHEAGAIPKLNLSVDATTLTLQLSRRWYDARPLLRSDLEHEHEGMVGLGIEILIDA